MKYLNLILAGLLVAMGAIAAQDTALDGMKEVRDPVQLKTWLEANAADAQTRIAALEGSEAGGALAPGAILVGNASTVSVGVAVSGDLTLATNGVATIANGAVTAAKTATAVQTNLLLAASALQPNAVNVTNVISTADGKTNTIIVLKGLITSWTVVP
jgi:hypothetical protein